jgi:hypothetical protein
MADSRKGSFSLHLPSLRAQHIESSNCKVGSMVSFGTVKWTSVSVTFKEIFHSYYC